MVVLKTRTPRALHPGAWWIWALGMSTAASRTTNPLLLALILAVVAFVVGARRTDAPWAFGFRSYLLLGAFIIAMRVTFRMFLDGQHGEHILFVLPELPLPDAVAGIRIGGPVSAEGLLAALYDGLRLATLVICLGAANVLANPKRLLKSVPSALHEVGVAVTVALTMAPQLVESGRRIHKARKLRGEVGRRTKWFREVIIPVITDALDRSLLLASAMDSRGYGRRINVAKSTRILTGGLLITGLVGICIGVYNLLSGGAYTLLSTPMLVAGIVIAAIGLTVSGKRVQRTRYRPDPWRLEEWGVCAAGVIVAGAMFIVNWVDPSNLNPSLTPLQWPDLPTMAAVILLLGLMPAFIAPPPPSSQLIDHQISEQLRPIHRDEAKQSQRSGKFQRDEPSPSDSPANGNSGSVTAP